MSLLARASDVFYTFRFLRLLTTAWVDTGAYKLGLIDETGKPLRKPETSEERDKYNIFHRLVFNLKQLLNKAPLGKTTIASYLAALYLIKEESHMNDSTLIDILERVSDIDFDTQIELTESKWHQDEEGSIRPGNYVLNRDILLPSTGEPLAQKHSVVIIKEGTKPHGEIFGIPVYEGFHVKTRQNIFITQSDILSR